MGTVLEKGSLTKKGSHDSPVPSKEEGATRAAVLSSWRKEASPHSEPVDTL